MKLKEVYFEGKKILEESKISSFSFDTMCIFELCFGLSRQDLILNGDKDAPKSSCGKFFELIHERANKRPLQYILGYWEFMGLRFKVGEGVLIPREDTQAVVDECLKRIEGVACPTIIDLCAGSGTISLAVAKERKDATVKSIELSTKAYDYLCQNIKINNIKNVVPINADISNAESIMAKLNILGVDSIVSNPPYIKKDDIDLLQDEVKNEPVMALDGGNDGLNFYRIIERKWLPYLKEGGSLCVEFGINQENDVAEIFKSLHDIKKIKDFNGVYRAMSALKKL